MFNFKEASVKVYAVEFCKIDMVNEAVYGEADSAGNQTRIQFNGPFLIREDEINKYRNYGGGIRSLTLVGTMIADEPTCKCSHEESEPKTFVSLDSTENECKEDPDAFVLKFIPENGGESCAEITYHNGMYSLVGTVIELQENSELGLNGSKVYNKFLFRRGGDTEFMPITYQQAREIKEELEE